MSEGFRVTLGLVGAICLLAGFAMEWKATSRYGNERTPRYPTLNPRHWKPVWRMRDHFNDEKGFDLFMWGDALIVLGAGIGVVVFSCRTCCG